MAPDGRMASSDWQRTNPAISVLVQPGEYGAVVMTYVPRSQPFQLTMEFRPQ